MHVSLMKRTNSKKSKNQSGLQGILVRCVIMGGKQSAIHHIEKDDDISPMSSKKIRNQKLKSLTQIPTHKSWRKW